MDRYPALTKSYILRCCEVDGSESAAICGIDNPARHGINHDALFVVRLLTGEHSKAEMADLVSSEYGIDSREALQSVEAVLQRLNNWGMLRFAPERGVRYRFPKTIHALRGQLDHVYIRLTNACDLRCRHCSVDAGTRLKQELSKQSFLDVIDQAYEMMVPSLTFTGGEPMLVEYLPDLITYASEKPMRVALMTNGYSINADRARMLKGCNLAHVNVSLDGANEKTHDRFRGVPGAFQRAVQALRLFKDLGMYVETTTVVHPGNANEIQDILKMGRVWGLNAMKFLPIVPFGRGARSAHEESLSCYARTIGDFFDDFGGGTIRRRKSDRENEHGAMLRCNAGSGILSIRANGDVLPCNNFDTLPLGNILRDPLMDIYDRAQHDHELIRAIQVRSSDCETCSLLDYCRGGCAVAGFAFTGRRGGCDLQRKHLVLEYLRREESVRRGDPVDRGRRESGAGERACQLTI